jgi:adhesin/invasin
MNRRAALPLLLAALLLPVLVSGCGKASPVAPSGSTVTLSADPSEITTPSGTSTITAVVRKPNGTVAAGVDVRFTTTIGTIDVLKATDSGGVATATLRGDGRSGTAMVNAAVDGGATATALSVAIGGGGHTITLQAIPASIPATGGRVKLVALVRDVNGQAAAGAQVNFTTNLGRLASGGGLVVTNSSGEATDTLSVQSADVGNQTSITVGAQTAAADGSLQSATFTVSILTNAAASIVATANPGQLPLKGGSVTLTALVRNSSGSPVPGAGVNFTTTKGTLGSGGGLLTADKNGQVTDSLFIPQQSAATTATVQAFTPGAGSNLISSNMVIITISDNP